MKSKDKFWMKQFLIEMELMDSFKIWRGKKRYNEYERKLPSIFYLPKKVLQFQKDWEFVREYESAKQASEKTWILEAWIRMNINWKLKSSWNFVWKYK